MWKERNSKTLKDSQTFLTKKSSLFAGTPDICMIKFYSLLFGREMDGEERTNKNECLLYICLRGHSRDKSVAQLAFFSPQSGE